VHSRLDRYNTIFERMLSRDEGRNPRAHYGTLVGIYEKPGGEQ
jgi:hypothetical protein